MTQPQAGWYPDPTPAKPGDQRYWDGQQWTAHVAPGATQLQPASPAAASIPADWYPDPTEPGQLRYWDGTAWTDHVHATTTQAAPTSVASAAEAAPANAAPAAAVRPRKRMSGLAVAAWIGVPVLAVGALGVGAIVMRESPLPECSEVFEVASPEIDFADLLTADAVCTDTARGLDFAATMMDQTARDTTFSFPATVRHDDPDLTADLDFYRQYDWGFGLFADAALTMPLPLFVEDSEDDEGGWVIGSQESPEAVAIYSDDYQVANNLAVDYERLLIRGNYDELVSIDEGETIGKAPSQWGLRDVYYLVRYVDERGEPLERPVVSQFGFTQDLATPDVVASMAPGSPGTVQLEWRPVAGAEWYLIVKSSVAMDADQGLGIYRDYEAVGATRETSWTTVEGFDGDLGSPYYDPQESYLGYYRSAQNNALRMFSSSEDDLIFNPDLDESAVSWEFGVIAMADLTDESVTSSAIGSIAANAAEANWPFAFAEYMWQERYPDTTWIGTEFASVDDIPTSIPIVNLAGAVIEADAVLALDTVAYADEVVRPGVVQVGLYAAGTQLGTPILIEVGDGESVAGIVEEFNERVMRTGNATGGMYDTASFFTIEGAEVVDVAPHVDYPIQGSHPFAEFLAAHLVARNEAVDVSAWLAQPGSPDLWDTFWETVYQNPYAYVELASYADGILYVQYSYPEGEYQQHQAELYANVEQAVDSLGLEGRTAAQRASAINDYLVDRVDYSYDALSVMDAFVYQEGGETWREYARRNGVMFAWEANGAWDHDSFVCAGYSAAFVAMAMSADLESVVVNGFVTYNAAAHAWNKVNIDGTWLAVDATWNDSPQGNDYLLISDREFTSYAARTEDNTWIIDANQPLYATP